MDPWYLRATVFGPLQGGSANSYGADRRSVEMARMNSNGLAIARTNSSSN